MIKIKKTNLKNFLFILIKKMGVREKYNNFISKLNNILLSKDIFNLIDVIDKYDSTQMIEMISWTLLRPELSKEIVYENLLVNNQYSNPVELCKFIHEEIVNKIFLKTMSLFNHKFNSYSLIGFIYAEYSKQYDDFISTLCFKYNQIKNAHKSFDPESDFSKSIVLETEIIDYITLFLVEFITAYSLVSLEEYISLFKNIFSSTNYSESHNLSEIVKDINTCIESYMNAQQTLKK
jgi:hypothetical protein